MSKKEKSRRQEFLIEATMRLAASPEALNNIDEFTERYEHETRAEWALAGAIGLWEKLCERGVIGEEDE